MRSSSASRPTTSPGANAVMPSAALRARASDLTSASTSPLIIRRLASQPHHLTGEHHLHHHHHVGKHQQAPGADVHRGQLRRSLHSPPESF
jgi:hypothetical protein